MIVYEHEGQIYLKFKPILTIIVVSIICLVIGFIYFIYLFWSNINLVGSDPLVYGLKLYNFSYCSCSTANNTFFVDNRGVSNIIPSNMKFIYQNGTT